MSARHEIRPADIMSMEAYGKVRHERRRAMSATKRDRRMAVGPDATFYFESFETMWQQVHEMLYIERGGEAQIAGELEAYNPLIPKGRELVATLMVEIEDPDRRARVLAGLGGIEEAIFIEVDGSRIAGTSEADIDRTTAEGKASSVQFIHFPFTGPAIAAFRTPGARVILGIEHPNYSHMAVMPDVVRAALAGDFD